jgi:protein required for attachment to host cells
VIPGPTAAGTFGVILASNTFTTQFNEAGMNATWIVSANAGRARFFSQERAGERMTEVNDMVNTAARLKTSDTETDDLGQRAASKSRHSVGAPTQPSGYEPNQTPVEHQTENFARDVGNFLLKAYQEGRFRHLVLTASPQFLGVLRGQLDSRVESAVSAQINKDYTQLRPDELLDRIKTGEKV